MTQSNSLDDIDMNWTGGILLSSRVTGKVAIAIAAFILCQWLAIESAAQTTSAAFRNVEAEWIRSRDPASEAIGRHASVTSVSMALSLTPDPAPEVIGRPARRTDGGILNLDVAFIAALRKVQLGETGTPEPRSSESSASTSVGADPSGVEKSKSKIPLDDPQDWPPGSFQPLPDHALDQDLGGDQIRTSFDWNAAFRQSMIFLGIQHAFRLATEKGTRDELKGPFFKDYFKAMSNLQGWNDGDPFLVNYIGHPMMGSVTGFIQVQNDPKGVKEEISLSRRYWRSRLKAFGWSFAYSTQFEIGLFSEAALGNIGIRPYDKAKHPMAYVDLVVTPVVGTGWLVGEDMLDLYLIKRIEDKVGNRMARLLIRSFLNPTRSFANLIRGKKPWYRDNRQ